MKAYLIHPLETCGEEEINRKKEEIIAKTISENYNFKLVRPFKEIPTDLDRESALATCLGLLVSSDCVILSGQWYNSEGCLTEIKKALDKDMPVYEFIDGGLKKCDKKILENVVGDLTAGFT